MNDNDPILNEERAHLKNVLEELSSTKAFLEKSISDMGALTLGELQKLRANPEGGLDLVETMQRLHEQNLAFNLVDKYARLEEMTFLEKEAYFSRIDLKDIDSDKRSVIYIGKFGFMGEKDPIITDWRAKVSSIFYRYRFPQKNVKYEAPDGVIEKDLMLKRTFEIDNSELVKYYNNDLQLDENEIIVDKIKQRTGGVLEDIIETIQESQLDIIESDPRQVCIVQGTVGSGKSTVAIHKLSHIFFNYQKMIRANRSILIAKNQILVSYLSTLFPKLGIFDINFKTLKDLIIRISFQEELKLEFAFAEENDLVTIDLDFIVNLRKQLEEFHTEYEAKIEDIYLKPEFSTFGGFVYNANLSIFENIIEVINDMNEEVEIQKNYIQEVTSPMRRDLHKNNIKTLKKIITSLRRLATEVNSVTFPKLLRSFQIDRNKKLTYKEALIFLVLYYELFGFRKFQKYEYCVVDEGQDFSVLEYLFLGKVVMNGRFCILGDLNQSYQDEGLLSWDILSEVINEASSANTYVLDTNYRSTKQIIDYANSILGPYTDSYLPIPINRMGPEPEINMYSSDDEMLSALELVLTEDLKNLDKSIGIICYSRDYYLTVAQILDRLNIEENKLVKLDSRFSITYQPKAIYLTMFQDCKGLEFAKVYNLGLNPQNVRSYIDAKKAFVGITRAMNEVSLYGISK